MNDHSDDKFLPADPIGELDPYEGCCHWCGLRGCDLDSDHPGDLCDQCEWWLEHADV